MSELVTNPTRWRCFRFLCPNVPVEELFTFNPLCGGQDPDPVCADHLLEHLKESLLCA